MLLLLNQELVCSQFSELIRLKISGLLKIPESAVSAALELKDGKLIPSFSVDTDEAEGVTNDQIEAVIASVYTSHKADFVERLQGLSERRA